MPLQAPPFQFVCT